MTLSPMVRLLAVCGAVLATGWACDLAGSDGPGGVGAPCNTSDDCEGDLACDFHSDKGSCQVAHDHEHESDASDSVSGSSTGTTTSTTTSTTDSATGTTGSTTSETSDTASTTTEPPETETGTDSSTGGPETTGDQGEFCEALCACLLLNCSSYDGYPYADTPACIAACEELDAPTVQCYGSFCEDAALETEPGLAEHWCEHATGELGQEKC